MFDYTESAIVRISAHQIGNKAEDELLHLSNKPLEAEGTNLKELLMQYFLSHFKVPEFYAFTFSDEDLTLNAVYNYVEKIFSQNDDFAFHKASVRIAQHLYNCSDHPNIKPGDLYVVHFSNILFEGEPTEAIGIFKAENKDSFIKLNYSDQTFQLSFDSGININKADKACLIFKPIKKKDTRFVSLIKAENLLLKHSIGKIAFCTCAHVVMIFTIPKTSCRLLKIT
jgi:hypothetical protein